jgi:hypothetical protein
MFVALRGVIGGEYPPAKFFFLKKKKKKFNKYPVSADCHKEEISRRRQMENWKL